MPKRKLHSLYTATVFLTSINHTKLYSEKYTCINRLSAYESRICNGNHVTEIIKLETLHSSIAPTLPTVLEYTLSFLNSIIQNLSYSCSENNSAWTIAIGKQTALQNDWWVLYFNHLQFIQSQNSSKQWDIIYT